MSGLNLTKKGVENTIGLYKKLGQEDTLECKTLKDWLAMYDLLKEMAEQTGMDTIVWKNFWVTKIRALIGE